MKTSATRSVNSTNPSRGMLLPLPSGKWWTQIMLMGFYLGMGSVSVMAQIGWTTVDEVKPAIPTSDPNLPGPGISGVGHDIGVAGSSIFSVGSARHDTNGGYSAIIRKSTDQGASWTEVDYYQPEGWPFRKYRAFGTGADGTLYAAGDLFKPILENQWKSGWMVQKSLPAGEDWSEDELYEENQWEWDKTACFDIKGHPNGDVYAVGSAIIGNGFSWIVRKKTPGGAGFVTVDHVGPNFGATIAHGVAFSGNSIFTVGRANGLWSVRRSTNQGASWSTVDTFEDTKGSLSEARGIAVHPTNGSIYVCGWARQVVKNRFVYNWVVRRSVNGGSTWTIVERYGAQTTAFDEESVMARAITVTPGGTVFVCGATPPPRKLMVRKGITSTATGVMTWSVSDHLFDPNGLESAGYSIAADALGNVYTTGQSKIAADGTGFFLTRRLQGQP